MESSKSERQVYFLTVIRLERPEPEDPLAPIGWLPVFRTPEAARRYANGKGEVGGISFPENPTAN